MFAVSRGRGGLDVKLDDIADRPGAALVTGYGANGRYPRRSASFPAVPPAAGRAPLSSRRVAAGDQQIREPQQQRDALLFFARPGSAPWRSRSAASRTGTDAQPSPAPSLALLGASSATPSPSSRRRPGFIAITPLDTAVPVLGTLLQIPGSLRRPTPSSQRHAAALPPASRRLRWPPSSSSCAPDPTRRPPRCAPSSRNTTACASSSDASQGPVRGAGSSSTTARR